jgi:hypothetical protein
VVRRRVLAAVAVGSLALVRDAAGQATLFPAHDVHLSVTVAANGVAAVREEFALTGALHGAAFELLEAPCSIAGPVSASVDGRRVALELDRESRAPWTILRIASDQAGNVLGLWYDVRLIGSEGFVPIVGPSAILEHADDSRGARVALDVELSQPVSDFRVLMPRLETTASNHWQGRFLAMPSMLRVRVSRESSASCDPHVAGAAGGLEWRFAIFVTAMAIWVPLYLWWFGKR